MQSEVLNPQSDESCKVCRYRIQYEKCEKHGELLNEVCLDHSFKSSPLICSICKEQSITQNVRPLKFYLEDLADRYADSREKSKLLTFLEQLEDASYVFYAKLRETVEQIAEEFRILEEEAFSWFQNAKKKVSDEISKRSEFLRRFESLKQAKGSVDLDVLVKQFQPAQNFQTVSNLEAFNKLQQSVSNQVKKFKSQVRSVETIKRQEVKFQPKTVAKADIGKEINFRQNCVFPTNIKYEHFHFKQTKKGSHVPDLIYLRVPLQQIQGSIKIKVMGFNKDCSAAMGLLTEQVISKMNGCFEENCIGKSGMYIQTGGNSRGFGTVKIEHLQNFLSIEIMSKGNRVKFVQKDKVNQGTLNPNIPLFVFLSLCGQNNKALMTHDPFKIML